MMMKSLNKFSGKIFYSVDEINEKKKIYLRVRKKNC
jgi:hypothetical protein